MQVWVVQGGGVHVIANDCTYIIMLQCIIGWADLCVCVCVCKLEEG